MWSRVETGGVSVAASFMVFSFLRFLPRLRACFENAFGPRPVPGRSGRNAKFASAATGNRSRSGPNAAFSRHALTICFNENSNEREGALGAESSSASLRHVLRRTGDREICRPDRVRFHRIIALPPGIDASQQWSDTHDAVP